MKIKNYEAINTYAKLGEILKNYSFKAKVCQAIVNNKNKLKEIVNNFDETRRALVKSLAEKDENGEPIVENGNYVIKDKEKLNKEFAELYAIETEVELDMITVDDLEYKEINGADYEALSVFID